MTHSSAAVSLEPSSQFKVACRAIASAGLIAGSLDIGTAFVEAGLEGKSPVYILQAIAGGMLGMEAFQGGWRTAALGAFFHFLIAFTAAAVFYLASRKLKFLVSRPVLSGVLYGIAVYCFMNLIVLRLSAYHVVVTVPPIGPVIKNVTILILMVGLPISFVVRKFSS